MDEDNILYNVNTEKMIDIFGDISNKKYDKLPNHLKFDEAFNKTGKQGLLGILKYKDSDEKANVVYKISQYINYIVEHENIIMQGLNDIREYCPHFCKGFGKITLPVDPDFRNKENPFEISDKYKIFTDALLMESIDSARKLYRYIKKKDFEEDILYSIIKQTLLAVQIAQNKKQFVHNDLHSNNILIKKCVKNSCMLYIIDEKHQYLVPTYGYYPTIIDYGFGYIGDLEGKNICCPLDHTDCGFMTDRFDPVADPKLFLITMSDELRNHRESKKSKVFRRLIKNIFKPLKVDWESGWDESNDVGASQYVLSLLEEVEDKSKSKFFRNYSHYTIGILQKLITLPLKKQSYKKIDQMYAIILEEFRKIEKEISSDFYNLYIFKNIIDFALEVKEDYLSSKYRERAVLEFRNRILNLIQTIAKFCNPKLDFEKLLCSLFIFGRQMEGVLYEVTEERMLEKYKEYNKLKISSCNEMYEAIETNIPIPYEINDDTLIYVFDCIQGKSQKVKLPPKYVKKINNTHNLFRGEVLYSIYKKNQSPSSKSSKKNSKSSSVNHSPKKSQSKSPIESKRSKSNSPLKNLEKSQHLQDLPSEDERERSDDERERSDDERERSDDERERSEDERERSEDERERSDDERERSEDEREKSEDEGERSEDERERSEDERERSEDERERSEDERERSEDERERSDDERDKRNQREENNKSDDSISDKESDKEDEDDNDVNEEERKMISKYLDGKSESEDEDNDEDDETDESEYDEDKTDSEFDTPTDEEDD